MRSVYSSGFEPDPFDTVDILAFVLCSPLVFVPGGSPEELAAVVDLIAPAKEQAIQRWREAQASLTAVHRVN